MEGDAIAAAAISPTTTRQPPRRLCSLRCRYSPDFTPSARAAGQARAAGRPAYAPGTRLFALLSYMPQDGDTGMQDAAIAPRKRDRRRVRHFHQGFFLNARLPAQDCRRHHGRDRTSIKQRPDHAAYFSLLDADADCRYHMPSDFSPPLLKLLISRRRRRARHQATRKRRATRRRDAMRGQLTRPSFYNAMMPEEPGRRR